MRNAAMERGFNPRVIAFACNWGGYAGADMAGAAGMSYPPYVRMIRLMCSARVDPLFVLEAFLRGADGALIAGCHPNFCHYIVGNKHVETRVKFLRNLMEKVGIEPERLRLEWISASEGAKFAEAIEDFTDQLRVLGPSPLTGEKPDPDLLTRMEAAKASAEDFRLRALVGKERKLVEEGNVYGEKVPQGEFDEVMDDAVSAEYVRKRIYLLVRDKPLSVKELAGRLGLDPRGVLRHIVVMRRRGLVAVDRIQGTSPLYRALEVR